jgi:hypothetical protein
MSDILKKRNGAAMTLPAPPEETGGHNVEVPHYFLHIFSTGLNVKPFAIGVCSELHSFQEVRQP